MMRPVGNDLLPFDAFGPTSCASLLFSKQGYLQGFESHSTAESPCSVPLSFLFGSFGRVLCPSRIHPHRRPCRSLQSRRLVPLEVLLLRECVCTTKEGTLQICACASRTGAHFASRFTPPTFCAVRLAHLRTPTRHKTRALTRPFSCVLPSQGSGDCAACLWFIICCHLAPQ